MEIIITTDNYNQSLSENENLIIDFWAPWCGPCKVLSPKLTELSEKYEGKVVIGKCNADEEEDLSSEIGIRNIPTLLFFKNGELVDRLSGALPITTIENKIKEIFLG
jgi:thioredoxin 1